MCIIYHKNDWVISHGPFLGMLPGGSLNEKFQIENASCKELLRIELKNNDPTTICYWDKKVNNHDRHFTDPELRAVTITLRRMLNMPEEADFRTPDYVKQMICRESLYWA